MLAAQDQPDDPREEKGQDENDQLLGEAKNGKEEEQPSGEGLWKKNGKILGMNVKKPTTFWNVFALLLIPAIKVSAHAFTNDRMNVLLQDDDYFGMEFEDIGGPLFTIMAAGQIASVLLTPAYGYAYDLFGRFWLIIGGLYTIAFCMVLIPLMSPSFGMVVFVRMIMSIAMRLLLVKPLLIDYLKDGSRGFGMTMQTWGFLVGEILNYIMIGFTSWAGLTAQFFIGAILVAGMVSALHFIVREPTIKDYRIMADGTRDEAPMDPNLSLWEKIKKLTGEAWNEVLTRPKYAFIISLLAVSRLMNILFQVYF